LNGVLGTTQSLLDTSQSLDSDQKEMVETIRDSGQTLLALISDVLDLTKIESGKFELEQHVNTLIVVIHTFSLTFVCVCLYIDL
jgi:signal transduction histidine kinase